MKLNVRPTVISNPLHPDTLPYLVESLSQVKTVHLSNPRLLFKSLSDSCTGNMIGYIATGSPVLQATHRGTITTTSLKAVLLTRLDILIPLLECLSMAKTNGPENLGSYLTIASCFWTWWRTQPAPKVHPDIRPYVRARKYLRVNAQSVNVPKAIVEDLILASRKAIIQDTHGLFVSNGCYALPTLLIHQMLEVVETCIQAIPFVPNDEANTQARGLGNMVAFWERMRSICPKVNIYHGPILTKEGKQCITDKDLDLAMLATRKYWPNMGSGTKRIQ